MKQANAKPVEGRELRAPAVPEGVDREILAARTGVGEATCLGGNCVLTQTWPA